MEKYKIIEVIGKGSFGEVFKAVNRENGEIVAIKTMKEKFSTWEECMNLRELKSLRKLQHKNVVKLKEVLRVQSTLSFVFEHVDQDIYKLYENHKKEGTRLSESEVRSIFYQLAQSLAYIHKNGYFHRDLKPENILISNKDKFVKLIDFGLAREIRSRPPYTEYVSTRWYRAPELLLRSTNYNSPVDVFALGCIVAELYMLKPLFNGSSEIDQLNKITSVLGTPSKTEWPEGYRLAAMKGISIPSYPPIPLSQVISDCPPEALQLIGECLKWDSNKRPTASKILLHPYFKDIEQVLPKGYFDDLVQPKPQPTNSISTQPNSSISQSSNINNNMNSHNNNNNNDLNVSFGNDEVKVPLAKRLSNQFSQSDVSIVNKTTKVTPEYKPIKASDLSSQYGDYYPSGTPQYSYPGGDSLSTKPPLNPMRVSRQSQRNPTNNIKKDSGFNYTDLYNTDDFVEQPKNALQSITDKKSPRDFSSNTKNTNTNAKLSNFDALFADNFNVNGIGNINNGLNNNYGNSNNNPTRNIPLNPQPTSSNLPEQSSFPAGLQFQSSKQTSSKSTMEYPTSLRMNNNNNLYSNISNPETTDDKNDILGNYMQAGNNNKTRSHGYSNSQLHPRQLQQVSSAVERRSDVPYSQLNFTASPNPSNYDNIYQPTRSLKPTDMIDKEFAALSSMNPQPNSQKSNGIGYREFNSANQATRNGTNLNQMSPYKFANSNNILSSNNYPQPASNYMPSAGLNYLPPSNYPSEIKNFSSGIAPNLASAAQYGMPKQQNPIITTNTTKNTNAQANRNLYDFNNIRQPMRPSGLPLPQYDKKY